MRSARSACHHAKRRGCREHRSHHPQGVCVDYAFDLITYALDALASIFDDNVGGACMLLPLLASSTMPRTPTSSSFARRRGHMALHRSASTQFTSSAQPRFVSLWSQCVCQPPTLTCIDRVRVAAAQGIDREGLRRGRLPAGSEHYWHQGGCVCRWCGCACVCFGVCALVCVSVCVSLVPSGLSLIEMYGGALCALVP